MAPTSSKQNRPRHSFADVLDATRVEAAKRAFRRAVTASKLRKWFHANGRRKAASFLARQKVLAISRALQLAPELIRVTIDDNFQVGLLSIRFPGIGRLHLPPATVLPPTRHIVHPGSRPDPRRAA